MRQKATDRYAARGGTSRQRDKRTSSREGLFVRLLRADTQAQIRLVADRIMAFGGCAPCPMGCWGI